MAALVLTMLMCCPTLTRSQDVVSDAVAWLPPGTIALEYSDATALRGLPDYQTLRRHFLGRNLQSLENSLATIGIAESDINQLVLAWQSGNGKAFQLEGLATGTFDPDVMAQRASAAGIKPANVDGSKAYCVAAGSSQTCVVVLQGSLGIFGPLPVLNAMLQARAGTGSGLAGGGNLAALVQGARANAPIWGVALGSAVSKWFESWMPAGNSLQMNWGTAFRDVSSLSYRVNAGDDIDLRVKLMCASDQAAASLSQLMQGLKLIQSMAWQRAHPSQSNPFSDLDIEAADNQVTFHLTASYAALANPGMLGKQP